jgi:IS30 family transposase
MSYQHLTLRERFTLYQSRIVLKESLSTIAAKMGRAKSTLSRELRRNQISGVKHFVAGMEEREETLYLPDTAEVMAAKRREEAKSPFRSQRHVWRRSKLAWRSITAQSRLLDDSSVRVRNG